MEHGRYRYTHYKCRCDVCRKANSDYYLERRKLRSAKGLPDHVEHGTVNAYWNYECRCEICKKAASDSNRKAYKQRKKAS